ncbi:DUF5675 family protein [Ferrimonas balearica]|uniref:DUF5675 family protein n=1 Tax=Ferrimonas balearica TaxID=44012 RepID=UPI001C9439B7|nr:DUF5675 family protein [Ferrimonas balearica]MBY6223580.1 hypothetical protein [Ferrimonas balearica]
MALYTLHRRYLPNGTFSTLSGPDGQLRCHMLERPWRNNAPFVSCVPPGRYRLLPNHSPKFGAGYRLESANLGVGHSRGLRTHILIHPANRVDELSGCLAPGRDFGVSQGRWAVVESRAAFDALMAEWAGQDHELEISL